jgi:hypothetical protein
MNESDTILHNFAISNDANIAALEKTLSHSTHKEKMSSLLKELGEWSAPPPSSSPDRILVALREFIDHGFTDLSHARLLCNGCIQSLGEANYRFIEDPNRFIELLKYVSSFYKQTRPFRRCYRRLLNAYFLYDPKISKFEHSISNAEELRVFLNDYRRYIKTPDFNPEWVTAVSDHKNLLTDKPCERYALAALEGNRDEFNDICKRLEIIDTSWLIGRLVLSTVDAAIGQDDDAFKDYIVPVIQLLDAHPVYINIGLGKLLNRYVSSANHPIHTELREYAVKCWKNPWLSETKENWQYCNHDAREMIASWLKRHLLREFFSILSEDGVANTRRVNFWELYCEDPQGMYFALGPAASYKRNERFNAFIKDAHGLCRKLDGGKSENEHAFIMQFQNMDVIEFSLKGNSTYFYSSQRGVRPYSFNNLRVDVGQLDSGRPGLKAGGEAFIKRSRHADMGQGLSKKWEQSFAEFIGATSSSIREFCRKYKCNYMPASRLGSNEWIMHSKSTQLDETQFQYAVLLGWGFSWSADKKGWYRAGN